MVGNANAHYKDGKKYKGQEPDMFQALAEMIKWFSFNQEITHFLSRQGDGVSIFRSAGLHKQIKNEKEEKKKSKERNDLELLIYRSFGHILQTNHTLEVEDVVEGEDENFLANTSDYISRCYSNMTWEHFQQQIFKM